MSRRRRRPPSPRELRDRRSTRNARLAGLGVVLFGLLAGGGVYVASLINPALGADLCPTGREPEAEVVVLLDATDPWNATQRAAIRAEFARIQESVPRFGRVRLFALEERLDGLPEPVLELCNPGREGDFASVPVLGRLSARFFANPAQLARWRGEFEGALDGMLREVAEGAGGRTSPIMETIQGIALDAFPRSSAAERRLYVFSDMLQHSPAYSHYQAPAWLGDDAGRLADVAAAGTSHLRGVGVEVLLLDRRIRGEGRGPADLVGFWETWFAEQGAVVDRVRRMEG